jgi:hypothetical protein
MEIAHVTSAALDENAKAGRHVVKIIPVDLTGTEQKEVALGTLELGRTGTCSVDGIRSDVALLVCKMRERVALTM